MVAQVGQAALGFTVFDAHKRLQEKEEHLRSDFRYAAKSGYWLFDEMVTRIGCIVAGAVGLLTVAGRTHVLWSAGNLHSVYCDTYVLGGFSAALGSGLVYKAISDVEARWKKQTIHKIQAELDSVQKLDSTYAFQGNDGVALELEDGNFLSFLWEEDFQKLSIRQLHAVYKLAPDRFWRACDTIGIDQAKLLPLIKLDQFLHLSTEQLIEALTDEENDLHFIQYPCLLEWLIQDLPEYAKVVEHLQNKISRNFPAPLTAHYLEEALKQIRRGKSIEDLKNIWSKAAYVKVSFSMGQRQLEVSYDALVSQSVHFKNLLDAHTEDKVLEDDGNYEMLQAIFHDIDGIVPLQITFDNWKAIFETADKYHFTFLLRRIESFCMRNISEIVAKSSLLDLATFAKEKGRNNLLEKLDKEYMESLLQKGETIPLETILSEFRIAQTHALSKCAMWLSSLFTALLEKWLMKNHATASQFQKYLALWELVPESDRDMLLGQLVQFLGKCVKSEAASCKKKLLRDAWETSCTHNNKILQDVIASFCRDPDNKFYREIAWPTLPPELRTRIVDRS